MFVPSATPTHDPPADSQTVPDGPVAGFDVVVEPLMGVVEDVLDGVAFVVDEVVDAVLCDELDGVVYDASQPAFSGQSQTCRSVLK